MNDTLTTHDTDDFSWKDSSNNDVDLSSEENTVYNSTDLYCNLFLFFYLI